jgi:hypothetical protein
MDMSTAFAGVTMPRDLAITLAFLVIAALIAGLAGAARRRLGIDVSRAFVTAGVIFGVQMAIFGVQALIGLGTLWAAVSAGIIGSAFIGHVPRRPTRRHPVPVAVQAAAPVRRRGTSRPLAT